ncbi:MAG: hypothetical protein QNK05_04575 [Myxococcota bacterium]|nr:hypothetical protein [Myxococcota bacterium]
MHDRACLAFVLLIAALGLACGPIVTIPGGRLSGEVASPPADWSFTDAVDTMQLETAPDDPYSVNVWATASAGSMYVVGREGSGWVDRATANPEVRLRVGDTLYELRAVPVTDEAELDALVAAIGAKYDFEPDPEDRARARPFRLEAR